MHVDVSPAMIIIRCMAAASWVHASHLLPKHIKWNQKNRLLILLLIAQMHYSITCIQPRTLSHVFLLDTYAWHANPVMRHEMGCCRYQGSDRLNLNWVKGDFDRWHARLIFWGFAAVNKAHHSPLSQFYDFITLVPFWDHFCISMAGSCYILSLMICIMMRSVAKNTHYARYDEGNEIVPLYSNQDSQMLMCSMMNENAFSLLMMSKSVVMYKCGSGGIYK